MFVATEVTQNFFYCWGDCRVSFCLLLTHLVKFSLCLSQPQLVFHRLSLHLLVVGLQRADQVAHLSVNRT